MSESHIVIGCGWGDEGKGVFVNHLAGTLLNPVVIRFNGGHQAGHTVTMSGGKSHVFSSFGSGSYARSPTFVSRYCTIDPVGMHNEFIGLRTHGISPILYVDPLAMVTTPYDKFFNTAYMLGLNHGTVGVGFGATVERNESPYKLHAIDLFSPEIFLLKLEGVKRYYLEKFEEIDKVSLALEMRRLRIDPFLDICKNHLHFKPAYEQEIFSNQGIFKFENFIFEGAQGVMLDMDLGVFPHVTRSNTTSRNAIDLLRRNGLNADNIYHLHRAYSTRHGNGPFKSLDYPIDLKNNDMETNVAGGFQGVFKTGLLDIDSLDYAMQCEVNVSYEANNHHQVVSCLDQLTEWKYIFKDEVKECHSENQFLQQISRWDSMFVNRSPYSETIQRYSP